MSLACVHGGLVTTCYVCALKRQQANVQAQAAGNVDRGYANQMSNAREAQQAQMGYQGLRWQDAQGVTHTVMATVAPPLRPCADCQAETGNGTGYHAPEDWDVIVCKACFDVRNGRTDDGTKLEAAKERIAELEELNAAALRRCEYVASKCTAADTAHAHESARANRLSDEAGALRTERDDLLRENAVLRRTIERLERKGGKR